MQPPEKLELSSKIYVRPWPIQDRQDLLVFHLAEDWELIRIGVISGLRGDNGKMETTVVDWAYIGIVVKSMETL